jgi:histidinol-phosphate aminotransferase
MDKNESPRDIPDSIKQRVLELAWDTDFARYNATNLGDLRVALGAALSVPADTIITGNGSDECILILSLAFGGSGTVVIVPTPTFGTYVDAARWSGATVVNVPRRAPTFDLDVDEIVAAGLTADANAPSEKRFASIVYLCRPNNPTGNTCTEEDVRRVLNVPRCLVVVDEAYFEFANMTVVPWTKEYENLIVLRTFSKAYSIAGLRVGYMISNPELVKRLDQCRLPYNVNVFSQAVALVVLEERNWFIEWARTLAGNCRELQGRLSRIPGVRVFPSITNFVLFETPLPARDVYPMLVDKGIMVRQYPSDTVLERCLRVSVGNPEQDELFLRELRTILAGTHIH